jgi:hypothetical protein
MENTPRLQWRATLMTQSPANIQKIIPLQVAQHHSAMAFNDMPVIDRASINSETSIQHF